MSLKRIKEIFKEPRSNEQAFLIIGTQKEGTTALNQYLSLHPELGVSKKEIRYFNCDVNYSKGKNFYLSHFGPQPDKKSPFFFDVSPGYLAGEKAAERIFEFNPKIKLIAILRDPLERAFSAWNMYRPRFLENDNWYFDWMRPTSNKGKL